MIFHKSLSKKKGASYSFFSGLSASFVPAVLMCLFQTLMMAILPLVTFINIDYGNNDTAGEITRAKDLYKFLVFAESDTSTAYIVFGLLGILSMLVAVRLFNFICDKKTVNVFYSLGIKRTTLFMSKYFAGAVLLIAANIIPVILSYIVNLIFLGGSWQLSLVLLHMYCGFSVFSLVCFSVAAIVFSSVGTVSEAIVYSVALLFAPTIIIYLTERIIGAFLPSSTINEYVLLFDATYHNYWSTTTESLLEKTSALNPLLFFTDELCTFAKGAIKDGQVTLPGTASDSAWYFPNILVHLPWFVIAMGLGFAGSVLFRRIKAENCGFLNTNKILSNLTIFELCLVGSSIMLSEMEWTETWVVIAVGAAAAFGLYLIAEIFLKRNFIKILKALYKFVAHMAVIAIIYGVCATGLFGYANYIPDIADILSAQISAPISYSQISLNYADYMWTSDSFMRVFEPYRHTLLPEMTESADIDKVIEINKLAAQTEKDDGFKSEIVIRYNLKNGKESERRLTLTSYDEIAKLLELTDTTAYKNELKNLFYSGFSEADLRAEYNKYGWIDDASYTKLAFSYKSSEITARSNSLTENRVLKLTEAQFNTLRDAVYKDLVAQNAQSYFLSDKAQLGVLSFGITDEVYAIGRPDGEMHYYEEGMTQVVVPVVPETEDTTTEDIPVEELFPEQEYYEESKYQDTYYSPYSSLGNFMSYEHTYDVIITEDMVNTLAALKSMDYADCFKSELTIESVSFREYDTAEIFAHYTYRERNYVYDFFAYPINKDEIYGYDETKNPEDEVAENKITDKARLSELDSLMKLHEYSFDDGYFCLVKYTDGTYCVKYLSRDDAPDYVRNFNYVLNGQTYSYY